MSRNTVTRNFDRDYQMSSHRLTCRGEVVAANVGVNRQNTSCIPDQIESDPNGIDGRRTPTNFVYMRLRRRILTNGGGAYMLKQARPKWVVVCARWSAFVLWRPDIPVKTNKALLKGV